MPTVKIRFSNIVKKVRLEPITWQVLSEYVEQAFSLSLDSYKLMCIKPLHSQITRTSEFDSWPKGEIFEIEIIKSEDSF